MPERVVELIDVGAHRLPPADIALVAPRASLVVRKDLHPAIEFLLLRAARQIHAAPGVFQGANEFPSDEAAGLPLSDAARRFYTETLGLRLVAEEQFALVFDLNGVMLRMFKVQELQPARHTVLGWRVADIVAKVNELGARGVTFERFDGMSQDVLGIWTSPTGARVAWFKDPDGNALSLTQFA